MKKNIIDINGRLKIGNASNVIDTFIVRLDDNHFDCENADLMLVSLKSAWKDKDIFDLSMIDKLNPKKKYILKINLAYPEKLKKASDFGDLAQTSVCTEYLEDASAFLSAVKDKAENLGNVIGYQLCCGEVGWCWGVNESKLTPQKIELFKKSYPDLDITEEMLTAEKEQAFLNFDFAENVKTYRHFIADMAFDTVSYFTDKLNTEKLVGVEFACPLTATGKALWDEGQLCFDKIFACDSIDFIASSEHVYEGSFASIFDSINLHNKLYFHLASEKDFGSFTCDMLNSMVKGSGISVCERFFEEHYSQIVSFANTKAELEQDKKESISQTAVIVSAESMENVNKNNGLNNFIFSDIAKSLTKLGAPYDVFSMADFDGINIESYKFIIFVNAFVLTKEQRDRIEALKCDGRTLLWLYAPDYYVSSLARLQNIVDMSVIQLIGEENSVNTQVGNITFQNLPQPRFFIEDSDTMPLGVYPNTEKTAIGLKKFGNYTSCYSTIGSLNGAILNDIAKIAGVKLFSFDKASVFVDGNFLGAYAYENASISGVENKPYINLLDGSELVVQNNSIIIEKGTSILIKK